ncbi:MAG TPA: c-type cytochrome, partial [Terriglobia bacterium]|nr:c-type cytochrome [Terriglobia bacterium]
MKLKTSEQFRRGFVAMGSLGWLTGACLVAVFSGRALLWAQSPAGTAGVPEGNQTFVARCGGCHGADARGSDRGPALAEVRRLRTRSVQQ